MTPLEAWNNVSQRLFQLLLIKQALGEKYSKEDIDAEVQCYAALKLMEERQNERKKQNPGGGIS